MLCRLFRHDNFGELFQAVSDFYDSGGIAAVLPQHNSTHNQPALSLPSSVQDNTLHVYCNAQVADIFVPKKGPGISFVVSIWSTTVWHVLHNP